MQQIYQKTLAFLTAQKKSPESLKTSDGLYRAILSFERRNRGRQNLLASQTLSFDNNILSCDFEQAESYTRWWTLHATVEYFFKEVALMPQSEIDATPQLNEIFDELDYQTRLFGSLSIRKD